MTLLLTRNFLCNGDFEFCSFSRIQLRLNKDDFFTFSEAGFGAGSETDLDDDSANSERDEAILTFLKDALNEACEFIRETHSIDFDERQALDMLQEHFQNHDKKAKKADPTKQDYVT